MLEHITSYASATGGTVVNDVERVYNGFRQLITEYQEHDGAVSTETSLNVQYSYADGSGNTIRLTGITYPNQRQISLVYHLPADDVLSRDRHRRRHADERTNFLLALERGRFFGHPRRRGRRQ